MGELTLQTVKPNHNDLIALLSKLDRYLYSLYPAEEVFVIDLDEPKANDVVFVIAYLDNTAVGCGAYRPLDGQSCELKRIFVDPAYRNKGIASRLLSFLEQEAARAGFTAAVLETGIMQPESIGLYKKFGFVEIERFGEYADSLSSICMGKKLP
ncbi:GNAT family N-acetyltransferase [Paenibacillus hodogayensis]|uniref:GNAT family N-acetyltransferase n=1 Tax=Paenibacillus hodogayensis TaxID=279208 RepID=A0ABV5VPM9_9BACL